jgi:hypothetical protein
MMRSEVEGEKEREKEGVVREGLVKRDGGSGSATGSGSPQ